MLVIRSSQHLTLLLQKFVLQCDTFIWMAEIKINSAQVGSVRDIFCSLSDNIQETFGITPIEAMSAGLPVVVSDWDGYRDTVRDGIDGFRVPTQMPPPGYGDELALRHF